MSSPIAVRRATSDDAKKVTTVLAKAFTTGGPVDEWLISDPLVRYDVYLGFFAIFVNHALKEGHIDITTDETGVAMWLPHDATDPTDYETRRAKVCGPYTARFAMLDELLDQHHPRQPHSYLPFLGVIPAWQNRGAGSALLAHHHAYLDAAGMPAYLEAAAARSRDLYARNGYDTTGPFSLPNDGPPLWPMWRKPHQA